MLTIRSGGCALWALLVLALAGCDDSAATIVLQKSSASVSPCSVPSAGMSASLAAGLTLYDPLCDPVLNGSKWTAPEFSRSIAGGAANLTLTASNQEPLSFRGLRYTNTLSVFNISSTNRATNLQADIAVPAATASRTGASLIRAEVAFTYQPAANRLNFPGGAGKVISGAVNVSDSGTGLVFGRYVALCTSPSCNTTDSATNIVYADNTFPIGQAASYGATYTLGLSFDETTRVFTFKVSGGGLAGPLTGTADASALFSAQLVDPVADALSAQIRVRSWDAGTGGGSGRITATVDNVQAGFNTGVAAAPATLTPYDDFSGIAPNSGPDFIFTKWGPGHNYGQMGSGALALHSQFGGAPGPLTAALPYSVFGSTPQALAVDATITAFTAPLSGGIQQPQLLAALYNSGTAVANNSTGDVWVLVALTPTGANWQVSNCTNQNCGSFTVMNTGGTQAPLAVGSVPFGIGTTHTLRLAWSPATNQITVSVDDGVPTVANPTTVNTLISSAAPNVSVSASPQWLIRLRNNINVANENGMIEGHFNNVMIK